MIIEEFMPHLLEIIDNLLTQLQTVNIIYPFM
jgi:hypothetical protein